LLFIIPIPIEVKAVLFIEYQRPDISGFSNSPAFGQGLGPLGKSGRFEFVFSIESKMDRIPGDGVEIETPVAIAG
jgi:hypothetical protein